MNKEEVYTFLKESGISFEVTEHNAVFTMEELDSIVLPYPEWNAKNLFIRDDKKSNYFLISVRGDKHVDLKSFRKRYNLRPLSFASADELLHDLGLMPGSVSPLGILNDNDRIVRFCLDEEFEHKKIGVHPNDNTATVWLQTSDLVNLIKEHGNSVEFVKI